MITKESILGTLARYTRNIIPQDRHPSFKQAAILILLFPKDNQLNILLTVRTHDVESHKGQVSCPGGMRDSSDLNLHETALREVEEELGIRREEIEILGAIDDQPTPSKFIITPVAGYIDHYPSVVVNKREVADIFYVPLSVFIDKTEARTEEHEFEGKIRKVWYFNYDKYLIWGATAMILVNFAEIITGGKQVGR